MKRLALLLVVLTTTAWSCDGDPSMTNGSSGGAPAGDAGRVVSNALTGVADGLSLQGPASGRLEPGERGTFTVDSSQDLRIETLLTDLGGGRVPPECGTGVAGVCLVPPVPQNLPSTVTMTVRAQVRWEVRGQPADDYDATTTGGLTSSILLRPSFVELGLRPADPELKKTIVATVTLTANPAGASPVGIGNVPAQQQTVQLPLDVVQLPVELPTVAVMSVDPNLQTPVDAGYFVVIDQNGVVSDCAGLLTQVTQLQRDLGELTSLGALNGIVGAAAPRVAAVPGALSHQSTQCVVARTVRDFSQYVLRHHQPTLGINGLSAQDSLDSVLLIGVPGKKASFFNDRAHFDGTFEDAGGYFELTTGTGLFSLVPNLEPTDGVVGNVVPPGTYVERAAPQGRYFTDNDVFANQLSAMGFGDVAVQ